MKKFFTLCALLVSAMVSAVAAEDIEIAPTFTGWAGKDLSVFTKGVVQLNSQYMQLQVSGLTGKSDVTATVVFAEPSPAGIQLCIDYEGDIHEYPQIPEGSNEITVTTQEGAIIENFGIQRQEAGELSVAIDGVYVDGEAVQVGGGWNDGFAGDADIYTYDITNQWGAAEYSVKQNISDYDTIILEFAEPCPEDFQVNVIYADDANSEDRPAYNVKPCLGETTIEIKFNPDLGPYVKMVGIQHTSTTERTLKVKKALLKAAPEPDPDDGNHNHVLEITTVRQKNPWDSQLRIPFGDRLEAGKKYTLTMQVISDEDMTISTEFIQEPAPNECKDEWGGSLFFEYAANMESKTEWSTVQSWINGTISNGGVECPGHSEPMIHTGEAYKPNFAYLTFGLYEGTFQIDNVTVTDEEGNIVYQNDFEENLSGISVPSWHDHISLSRTVNDEVPEFNIPTAISNVTVDSVKAQKALKNGQIVITRGAKAYNAVGQEL